MMGGMVCLSLIFNINVIILQNVHKINLLEEETLIIIQFSTLNINNGQLSYMHFIYNEAVVPLYISH